LAISPLGGVTMAKIKIDERKRRILNEEKLSAVSKYNKIVRDNLPELPDTPLQYKIEERVLCVKLPVWMWDEFERWVKLYKLDISTFFFLIGSAQVIEDSFSDLINKVYPDAACLSAYEKEPEKESK
jgi:hypothetical protein